MLARLARPLFSFRRRTPGTDAAAQRSAARRRRRNWRGFEPLEDRQLLTATLMINEIKVNPPGGDDNRYEYIELRGTPGASLNNVHFVTFNGSATGNRGVANMVFNLSGFSLGANGLAVIKSSSGGHSIPAPTNLIPNNAFFTQNGGFVAGTLSFYLFSSTTAFTSGTDYDTDNNGVLDHLPSGATVIDNIGIRNTNSDGANDLNYGGVVVVDVVNTGTPDAVSRFQGTTATNISAWYGGELNDTGNVASTLLYDVTRPGTNQMAGAILTPGQINYPNSAPTLSGPTSASVNQSATLAFTGGNLITLADSDASYATVALNATSGTMSVSLAGGASITAGASGTGAVTLGGTVAQLNAALASLVYTAPASGASATLTALANDGSANSNTLSVAITLNTPNSPPVLSGPSSRSVNQSATLAFTGGNLITLADSDSSSLTVALNATSGTMSVSLAGGASVTAGANGTGAVTLGGTLTQLNAALASLVYTAPASGSSATLTALANDGSANSNTLSVAIALNAAPVLSGPSSRSVNQGGTLTFSGGNLISLTDPDSGSATVALNATSGTMSVSLAGGASITAGANGTGAVTLGGTIAQVNSALATLVYTAPGSGSSATLTALANDGSANSNTLSVAIALNAAPVLSGPSSRSVNQGATLTFSGGNLISLADPDSGSATVALNATSGTINVSLAGGASITAGANGTGAVTLGGTIAQLNSALATLVYTAPGSGSSATLTALANDGSANSNTLSVAIALNAAPVLSGPSSRSVNQGATLTFTGGDLITVADPDSGSATVALNATSGTLSLSLAGGASITAGANGTGAVTIGGSIAQLNAALATLVYTAPGSGSSATLTALADDGSANSNALSVAITLNAAPVLSGPSSCSVDQSATLAFSGGNLITLADSDSSSATVALNATSGTMSVSLAGGASITAGANGTFAVTLGGTIAQLNAALATLVYTAPGSGSSATLTALANDGSANSNTLSIAITLTSPPTYVLGDMNGDGTVDNFDIGPLELAIVNPSAYLAQFPTLTDYQLRGDINQDSVFNNFDIGPFETLVTTGHYPAPPAASATTSNDAAFALAIANSTAHDVDDDTLSSLLSVRRQKN